MLINHTHTPISLSLSYRFPASSRQVWFAAVTQAFFSLTVGFGAITTLASYNSFSHNIYR